MKFCCFDGVGSYIVECDRPSDVIISQRVSDCISPSLTRHREDGVSRRAPENIDIFRTAGYDGLFYLGIGVTGFFVLLFYLGLFFGLSAGTCVSPGQLCRWCNDCTKGGCGLDCGNCAFNGGGGDGCGVLGIILIFICICVFICILICFIALVALVLFSGYYAGFGFIFLVMDVLHVDPKIQRGKVIGIVVSVVMLSPFLLILSPIWIPILLIRYCVTGRCPALEVDVPVEVLQIPEEQNVVRSVSNQIAPLAYTQVVLSAAEEAKAEAEAEAKAERLLAAATSFYQLEMIAECMNALKLLKSTGRKKAEASSLLKTVSEFGETLISRVNSLVDAKEYQKARKLHVQVSALSPRIAKMVQERISFCEKQDALALTEAKNEQRIEHDWDEGDEEEEEDEEKEDEEEEEDWEIEKEAVGDQQGEEEESSDEEDWEIEKEAVGDQQGEEEESSDDEEEEAGENENEEAEEATAEILLSTAQDFYEQEMIVECLNALKLLKSTGRKKAETISLLKQVSELGQSLIHDADSFLVAKEYQKAKDLYVQVSSLSPRIAELVGERLAVCDLKLRKIATETEG